ncbi:MAG TPA: SurA N-terminal domain-containing protein [Rhizomicrobium sp.]
MMQQMRGFAKSWISSLFLLALALSFGVWGIGDMLRSHATDTSVATVGDVKIPAEHFAREFRTMQRRMSTREGHDITGEEARARGLDRKLLNDEIGSSALDQAVSHYGLVASDAQVSSLIRSMGAFRNPLGTFDHATFLQVLAQNNLTEDEFIGLVRGELTRNQLLTAASDGLEIPPGYAKLFFEYLNEHRAADYVQVSQQNLSSVPTPTDAQLTAYLKMHAAEFSTPEYRDITYLSVGPDDVANQIKVSDAEIRQRYDQQKDQYQIPEKRNVEQLTFPDEAAASAARTKIAAGAQFVDVAKSLGKSPSDISLGTLVEADLGADRGPPTFALSSGGVTQPVKFTFGWVLLHVTSITPAVNRSFDDVKETLRKQAVEQLAGAKITDISNAFEDARAGGATFTDAAARAGMHVARLSAVDRNGLAPDGSKTNLPASPEFLAQLTKAEVGEEGDPFMTADGHAYAIKINGVTPAKLKPLDSVRAPVMAAWTQDQRRVELARLAATLAQKAAGDRSLKGIAATLHASVQTSEGLSRQTPSKALSAILIGRIFAAPPGATVFAPSPDGKSYIVARVTGVVHPRLQTGNPMFQKFASDVANEAGSDMGSLLAMAWRDKLGVTTNRAEVERLAGGS